MTSFSRVRLRCPRCGVELRDWLLTSANNFGWVQWSDGYGWGTLFRPQSRLRKCRCGHVFLLDAHSEGEAPPLQARSRGWRWPWRRKPEPEALPDAGRLSADDLEAALRGLSGAQGRDFEAELRLWCCWSRNRARADAAGVQEPIGAGDDNAARLLGLLPADPREAILIRGQVLRDLGRFSSRLVVLVALGCIAMFAGSCGRAHEEQPPSAQEAAPMTGTLIDIGNGQCLDPQRLPKPWVLVQVTKGGLTFRAETDALKIPHRPPDPEGHVFEEQAYVTVGVGIPWQPQGSVVAEPATIDSNIARGIFTEVEPPWIKGRDRWRLQVYRLGGEAFYISPDRLVQCRNSTPDTAADWPNPFLQCQIIAFDGAAGINIKVSSEAVPVLPDVLTKIYEAVEALRHPCPSL